MSNDKDDFFSKENEADSSWVKFTKIGDSAKGTLVGKMTKPAKGVFPEQIVYELKNDDGEFINVGFPKSKSFIHDRLKNVEFGRVIGFKFVKEGPSATAGFAPAKSITVYVGDMDPDHVTAESIEADMGKELEDAL